MGSKDLKYSESHEWVKLDGALATVGISQFAVEQLTDLILIDLSKAQPGTKLDRGQVFGEIESVKAVSDLYAPISGEVVEVNAAVAEDVSILGEDPYEKGWLLKIKATNPSGDLAALLDHDAYQKKIAEEAH
ncbi:glycine cleavage system protein GcvH [soil metagenome]